MAGWQPPLLLTRVLGLPGKTPSACAQVPQTAPPASGGGEELGTQGSLQRPFQEQKSSGF